MSTKTKAGLLVSVAFIALSSCGDPAGQHDIQSYHSNRTLYSEDGSYRIYFSPQGRYYEVNATTGVAEKGNWYAQPGEICGKPDGQPAECEPAFTDGQTIYVGLGGYSTATGDRFGLQRRFGEGARRTSAASSSDSGAALLGLAVVGLAAFGQVVAATCGDGGCLAPAASSVPGGSGQPWQCRVDCTTSNFANNTGLVGDSLVTVTATIRAGSSSQARSLAADRRGEICREAGAMSLPGGSISCRR